MANVAGAVRVIAVLVLLGGLVQAGAPGPPHLEFEAPPALAQARARLESFDLRHLSELVQVVGLADPGPAIRVVLASETSDWARSVPASTVGLAFGEAGLVILFPARAPAYPHDTLEDVLRHEVAHVLIARAAGAGTVPRWFNEGLAVTAERPWGFEDRTRLVYELTRGPRLSLDAIDHLFAGDGGARIRAYALAGAFVRDLRSLHGESAPAEILGRVARGAPFEAAFVQATGVGLLDAEAAFWRRQRLWTTWVPFLTSPTAVWMLVTLLAVYAIGKRQQKRAALRRRWAEEDSDWPPESDGGTGPTGLRSEKLKRGER